MSTKRQPKGIPVGGQFAANQHDEASPITLNYGNLDRDTVVKESASALYDHLEDSEAGQNYLDAEGIDTLVFAGNQIDPPEYADIEYDIHQETQDKLVSDIDALVSRVPKIAEGWKVGDEKLFAKTVVSLLTHDTDPSDQFSDEEIVEATTKLIEDKEIGFDEFDLTLGKSIRYSVVIDVSHVE